MPIPSFNSENHTLRKDEALNHLAERVNVAQFVAYSPAKDGLQQTFSRIRGDSPNRRYKDLRAAIERLLGQSPDGTVNVRSYKPDDPRSKPFDYGLSKIDDVEQIIRKRISDGLHVIVNETVDVSDGGVSGVVEGGIVEFSPDDTPRCVEKPGAASLSLSWALKLLEAVYSFRPDIDVGENSRLEFSIHPHPRGWRGTNTLGWELEYLKGKSLKPALHWSNRFSRFLGDKAYGLLMGDLVGVPVPATTVFHRRIEPFSFGRDTGSPEVWVRTCPASQHPGQYATKHGWIDPYRMIADEDPEQSQITDPDTGEVRSDFTVVSAIVQSGVIPRFSGSFNVDGEGEAVIEGVAGTGDAFMIGEKLPEPLPDNVTQSVLSSFKTLLASLGHVRFEWVFDGRNVWIVQLHRGAVRGAGEVIVPGEASNWQRFTISDGLEALRSALSAMEPGDGLIAVGEFGRTSHIAEVIRNAGFPARVEANCTKAAH